MVQGNEACAPQVPSLCPGAREPQRPRPPRPRTRAPQQQKPTQREALLPQGEGSPALHN